MTSKNVASLSASLLKRGTRDQSHGFVLGRDQSSKSPSQADSASADAPELLGTEPLESRSAAAPAPGNTTLQEELRERHSGPRDREPELDLGGRSDQVDPVAELVRGVVQKYNQAFPFDPFFGSSADRLDGGPSSHRGGDRGRGLASGAEASGPEPDGDQPTRSEILARSLGVGSATGQDTGRDTGHNPPYGSFTALARQIETVVRQTVEALPTHPGAESREPEAGDSGAPEEKECDDQPALGDLETTNADPGLGSKAPDDIGKLAESLSRAFESAELAEPGIGRSRDVPAPDAVRPQEPRSAAPPRGTVDDPRAGGERGPEFIPPTPAAGDPDGLSPQGIIDALRQGERSKAERLFGQLTGLTDAEVDRMLYRSDGEELAAACRHIEMEQLQFVSLFIMIRKASNTAESVDVIDLKQTVSVFNGMSRDLADSLLIAWRQQPGS